MSAGSLSSSYSAKPGPTPSATDRECLDQAQSPAPTKNQAVLTTHLLRACRARPWFFVWDERQIITRRKL